MAGVTLDNVEKTYTDERGKNPVAVVKGIDLEITDGEFLVLVGPSGCGKSTTMRMVAGLEDITGGEIRIGDRRVNEVPPKDRDIGMVFQSYALYPHMSVADNLSFGLKIRKMSKVEITSRIEEVARMLDIGDLLDRRPAQLSGGQRQRVAMGRAIARSPEVFLFDEPLSNLDSALRVRMRAELAALHERLATTTIYVTHDQIEAMTLANRIAVLHEGVLQQVGSPSELFEAPANTFVATFIGSPSMNLIDPARFEIQADAHAIGFRPNDATPVPVDNADIVGTVCAVERMGWEAFVHIEAKDVRIVVRVEGADARGLELGAPFGFDLVRSAVHRFGDDGVRL